MTIILLKQTVSVITSTISEVDITPTSVVRPSTITDPSPAATVTNDYNIIAVSVITSHTTYHNY